MRRPRTRRLLILLSVVVLLVAGGVTVAFFYTQQNIGFPSSQNCSTPLGNAAVLRTRLQSTTLGGVTEYSLPMPSRAPNAPIVAPDGSVWFAEQSVPGVAHFFPSNATLVEYAWQFPYEAPPSEGGFCGGKTDTWGLALWGGKVWASDTRGNQIVSLDPSTGKIGTLKLRTNGSYPYTMTVGPQNTLWVAELFGSRIGIFSTDGTLHERTLPGGSSAVPSEVVFTNLTQGYYVDVGEAGANNGGVYSFNPANFAPTLVANKKLSIPTSVAATRDTIWVALHGSSSLGAYNLTTNSWSYYPTTYTSWSSTTLPYFVKANGSSSSIWFNEHFGDRIGKIDPERSSLTEYSLSDMPVNGSTIGNTVTFALGMGRAWFAELSGNKLGFVDASFSPGFSTSLESRSLSLPQGGRGSVVLKLSGKVAGPLTIRFADSEGLSSKPSHLNFTASQATVSGLNGEARTVVTISAAQSLAPGTYYALVTATDGLTYQSSVLSIVIT